MRIENNATQSLDVIVEQVTVDLLNEDLSTKFILIKRENLTEDHKLIYDNYVNNFCTKNKALLLNNSLLAMIVERYTNIALTEEEYDLNIDFATLSEEDKTIVSDFYNTLVL